MNLLQYIPVGKENAITRSEISSLTGLDERTIRRQIKEYVEKGIPVLSSSHHKGYWIAQNIDEIEEYLKECDNRRNSLYLTNKNLRKLLYESKGIKTVTVREHLRKVSSG